MNAKTTTVELECPAFRRDFEFSHAERLLQMKHNGGWRLPESSKFEFVDNVLRFKQDSQRDNAKQKVGRVKPGKTSSIKD